MPKEGCLTYARKKDVNHDAIGNHLRKLGYSVLDLWRAGYGIPDLAVGLPGFAALLEVKAEGAPKKLTPEEQKVRDRWTGPYALVQSPGEAEAALLELRGLA